jgi:fatty acid desaturase
VREARLLDRAYADYAWRTAVAFGILACGVLLAGSAPAASAVLIAFGSVQVGLIGHDAGHNAVFETPQANHKLGLLCWTFAVGVSFAYWTDRHTRHHLNPNDAALDPDVAWDFAAALTPFMAFTLRAEGWRFAIARKQTAELTLLCLNALAYCAPLLILGWSWLPTFAASQILASLYLAAVVAPNHIGMPTCSPEANQAFLPRQLRTTRNVLPHPVADFVFGGLNYQIEHHLFPTMPRAHFGAARKLVKPFCVERRLPYTECGVVEAFHTVVSELPRIAQRA